MIHIKWGMQSRTQLIQSTINRIGARSYLEIGCDRNQTFDAIQVDHKVGVDPVSGGTRRTTSDKFFQDNDELFDVIFIDGLHICDQVIKDIDNSLVALRDGGVIIMHDCLPSTEEEQKESWERGPWLGSVWKAFFHRVDQGTVDVAVVDIDYGCGMIINRTPMHSSLRGEADFWVTANYQDFENYYDRLRHLNFDQAMAWITGDL